MGDSIINFLKNVFPQEVVTVLVAAMPILELRGSIPLALGIFKFSVQKAFLLSIIGNLLPVLPLIFFLEHFSGYLSRKFRIFNSFFTWLFKRTRRRSKVVEKYGALGLILFVAIPLPVTGAWTGCAAAFLFGVKKRLSIIYISCGVLIAGVVVTLATLGVIKIWL